MPMLCVPESTTTGTDKTLGINVPSNYTISKSVDRYPVTQYPLQHFDSLESLDHDSWTSESVWVDLRIVSTQ
jgi:hypothetical protein